MGKFFERTIKSLEQAIAYARGDCEHEWTAIRRLDHGGEVKECSKCKVRVTTYPPVQ